MAFLRHISGCIDDTNCRVFEICHANSCNTVIYWILAVSQTIIIVYSKSSTSYTRHSGCPGDHCPANNVCAAGKCLPDPLIPGKYLFGDPLFFFNLDIYYTKILKYENY